MRRTTLLASPILFLVAAAAVNLDACPPRPYSVVSDSTPKSATADLADAPGAVRDTFLGRAYLPSVLPSAKDLSGYAGYVLNVYGTKGQDGICVQDPTRAPVLDPISYIAAGRQPSTDPVGDILTSILVRKGGSASGGFLSFVTLELNDSMRAEVVVEDVARQSAADLLDTPRLAALAGTPPRAGVCAREIVLVAELTSFKTRTYRELERKAKLAGYGLAVDGKLFGSASSFTNRYRLFIESRPIDAFRGPAPKPDTVSRITIKRLKFQFPLLPRQR